MQSWSGFRGVGSQSAAVDFELRLRCQPSTKRRSVQVLAQLEDASGGGATDHLQLAGESSATGLVVRLMRSDGGLLQFGTTRHNLARVRPEWLGRVPLCCFPMDEKIYRNELLIAKTNQQHELCQ